MAAYPEKVAVPVQTLRLGDVVIGTMPCEVFAEIGLEFKSRSPLKPRAASPYWITSTGGCS